MPTKRIGDLPDGRSCRHPEHDPPKHMVYEEGIWEHVCPACGNRQVFKVIKPRWGRKHRLHMLGPWDASRALKKSKILD